MIKDKLLDKILNHPKPLSETQRNAVLSNNRYIRVIAGAGAGKTETLTRRIAYLLIHEKVDPSSIVAFTFTEKAAKGMKSRVYDRLKNLDQNDLCERIGDLYIGTIHGYCSRILQDYFGYGNYDVFDGNQEMAFLTRIGWELGLSNKSGNYSRNCAIFHETTSVVNGELIDEAVLEKNEPDFLKHFKKYEAILDGHKRLTFDRMIKLAINELESNPKVLNHVKHLLVDEYQDINRAQEKLIELIGKDASIFIVGDPRQTIYKWRGSDESCFEDFADNHNGAHTVSISENRRSGKSILKAANSFSDTFENYKYEHIAPTRTDQGIVAHISHETDKDEAVWIADQIEDYVDGGCSYSDIGILFRSVATSAPPFIDVFRERDIPFIIGGSVGLFRREEAQTVGMLFCWLYEKGFWLRSNYGYGDEIQGDDLFKTAKRIWQAVAPSGSLSKDIDKKLKSWKNAVLEGKFEHFTASYYNLLRTLSYLKFDPTEPTHAVVMANLGRFNSLLTDYETAMMLGGRDRNWERDVKNLFWYIHTYATTAYAEQQPEDLRGVNAVQIVTIHQAKGLEWPVVFLPALAAQRFPSKMAGREKKLDINRGLYDAERYEGGIEDERRLFYVAMTRAKDVLVLSTFRKMKKEVSESRFISDIPHDTLKELSEHDALPKYQLTKGFDPEDIQTFTAGDIIAYKTCPYRFRLNAHWGYQPGFSEYLGYGNALHFCLRNAAEMIKEGINPVKAVEQSIETCFFMPFINDSRTKKISDAAKKRLTSFAQGHEDDMNRIREVEARIEFPLYRATIAGKVDVILQDGGNSIEIRDYKTSDKVTALDDSILQVQLYSLGMKMLGESVSKGSIAYLDEASLKIVPVKESALTKAKNVAEKHIQGIMNKDFSACPGQRCKACDYGEICRWKGN